MKKKLSLSFPRHLVSEPITYRLVKDYELVVNIIKAKITPESAINKGVDYLNRVGVEVKPLVQEIKWSPEKCTHCTACVPLCPVGAFSIERKERVVSFNDEKYSLWNLCSGLPLPGYRNYFLRHLPLEVMFFE